MSLDKNEGRMMTRLSILKQEARCLRKASEILPLNAPLKSISIHANDPPGHSVCWSEIADGWIVENERQGIIKVHSDLCSALHHLAVATTIKLAYRDAIKTPQTLWSVRDNPYGD